MVSPAAGNLTTEALEALTTTFEAVAIGITYVQEGGPLDALVEVQVDDHPASFAVAVRIQCTGADARRLISHAASIAGRTGRSRAVPLLVADRLSVEARGLLTAAGWSWLDRRGRLHVRAPGIRVDLDPRAGAAPTPSSIRGRGGVAVAYWLCENPGRPVSPGRDRARLGVAPSTVSTALSRLATVGLLDDSGAGVFPELFWELAAGWRPERTWVADRPLATTHAPPGSEGPGWCLSGPRAAAAWGAPGVSANSHLDLYVGAAADVPAAVDRYGPAQPGRGAAALAVADTPAVAGLPRPGAPTVDGWAVAPLVAVALDVAQDPVRGREILAAWEHPDAVWR